MSSYRWTVRNVDPEAIQLLEEVSETSGLTFGELLTDAIETWYDGLPEEDHEDTEESDDPVALQG